MKVGGFNVCNEHTLSQWVKTVETQRERKRGRNAEQKNGAIFTLSNIEIFVCGRALAFSESEKGECQG